MNLSLPSIERISVDFLFFSFFLSKRNDIGYFSAEQSGRTKTQPDTSPPPKDDKKVPVLTNKRLMI